MHKKYLSNSLPMLADGDFMGVIQSKNDVSEIQAAKIIKEGLERDERVYVDHVIYDMINNTLKEVVTLIDSITFSNCFAHSTTSTDLGSLRIASIEAGFSGLRYIASPVSFYLNTPSSHSSVSLENSLREILKNLMKGGISIAILYEDGEKQTFSMLTRHPRIYYQGKVQPNPLFLLPGEVEEHESELGAFLIKQERARKNNSNVGSGKGETFPLGVPNMLDAIIDSMGLGVVVGDLYGNMVLFNKAAQSIMGLPASPLPYSERIRRFGNFLLDQKTPYPFEQLPLSRAIRGEQFENEIIYVENLGLDSGKWLAATGRGVTDEDGNLVGGVVVIRDVTEEYKTQKDKEQLELTLLQAQKMESLGMLAGGIAHDFNNLLVGVLGNASILLQQGLVLEHGRVRLEQIEYSALQLSDLTRQLLMYAGLSPGRTHAPIDIREVVDSMRGIVETGISKKIELEWKISSDVLVMQADEVQIRQILLNLIVNASDAHSGSVGRISVSVYKEAIDEEVFKRAIYSSAEDAGEYIVLEVKDTGCGISQEVMDRVFDPFFSTKGIGRGLGLSAVLGIVKNHRGALELNSKVNGGTHFKIYFPLSDVKSKKSLEIEQVVTSRESGLVLVIDDEPMVLEVAQAILTNAGYEVLTASSGSDGLLLFNKWSDAILTVLVDMTMPDMSGIDVYHSIRRISANIPVVISSGFSKDLCVGKEEGDEHFHFLSKPYAGELLVETVSRLVVRDGR